MFHDYLTDNDYLLDYQKNTRACLSAAINNKDNNTMSNYVPSLVSTSVSDFNFSSFLAEQNYIYLTKEYQDTNYGYDEFVYKVLLDKYIPFLANNGFSIRGNYNAFRRTENGNDVILLRVREVNKVILCTLEFYSDINRIKNLIHDVDKILNLNPRQKSLTAFYGYMNDGRLTYFNDVSVKNIDKFYKECYPYIENVDKFIDDFIRSSSNVMILTGEPGTGKSTFINYLLHKTQSSCYIAYDEAVMSKDSFFIDFMSDTDANIMVLEDADILLTSRIKDDNKVMSKILNLSDGILALKSKKFVFTANIKDIDDIDFAISRPGRCFDIVNFRTLDRKEAELAAKAIGTSLSNNKSEYTIAEIFNNKSNSDITKSIKKERIGF